MTWDAKFNGMAWIQQDICCAAGSRVKADECIRKYRESSLKVSKYVRLAWNTLSSSYVLHDCQKGHSQSVLHIYSSYYVHDR